ncbi:hypothetical protein QAD02_016624 [Eretmocerus hayati]|uniref:Uncharacterized protein n=1 Tax=Eretmocerus hayati TaxID=131215 RepID=A0ACC2PBM2_9HYME|nr:hypothetical protein QAD02_016624 [Eretmocerus hayati]
MDKKTPLLFNQNERWQRFVHWLYINEDLKCLIIQSNGIVCYTKPFQKCLQYANDCGIAYSVEEMETVIQSLCNFVPDYKCHMRALGSLKDQCSLSIEKELATFAAPKLNACLKVWSYIFTAWRDIYNNDQHPDHEQIKHYIKLLLENKMLGIIQMKYLRYGHEIYKNDPDFFIPLYDSLAQRSRSDVIKLLRCIMDGKKEETGSAYIRGNAKFLFCSTSSSKFSDGWDIAPNEIMPITDRGEAVSVKSTFTLLQDQSDKDDEANDRSTLQSHDGAVNGSQNSNNEEGTPETDILEKMEETVSEYQQNVWKSSDFYLKMEPWQQKVFLEIYCSSKSSTH